LAIFEDDVKRLKEYFKVDYFSAHGGARGPNQEINRSLGLPRSLFKKIRWVHNGGTPRFHGNYSDGGYANKAYGLQNRDIREFVKTWQPGKRYRILTHPQYYTTPCDPIGWRKGHRWYENIINYSLKNPGKSVWDKFKVKWSK